MATVYSDKVVGGGIHAITVAVLVIFIMEDIFKLFEITRILIKRQESCNLKLFIISQTCLNQED
jgi:hypothetical protein